MFSKLALATATLSVGSAMAASLSCAAGLPYSCSNTTVVSDLCCFNYPGGAVLLTQFWDYSPATGPGDSWTVHGLWPDNCDGTYEESCDSKRAYTNITAIMTQKAPTTLAAMRTYWPDWEGDDESFWQHEWGKHGTCMSTLEPKCYSNYQATDEIPDYFGRTMDLHAARPSYQWLAAAGIVPKTSGTYPLTAIKAALKAGHGADVVVRCKSGKLNELWYHFNVQGSIQSGTFKAVAPVGSGSNCPTTVSYVPKYATTATTITTSTKTTTTTAATATGTAGALSGKGYVNVSPDGFLISGGNWYRAGGTAATYTATPVTGGFTLTTSAGPCQVLSADSSISCASGRTASTFGYDGTYLTYGGASAFYAASTPSGTAKGVVYTVSKAVAIKLTWKTL